MDDTVFPPTHWSAVLAAAGGEPEKARRAFERLCAYYRDAIAHWMRLQRLTPEDAEDAAHDFLEQWLQRDNPLQGFERGERRFREFLRVCLRRFLVDWRARRQAARRGGGAEHVSWEHDEVIADSSDTSSLLDFALATQIHQGALASLKSKWQAQLPGERFERLCAIAFGSAENPGYGPLARDFGIPVGTLKSWICRLRREYHDLFRDTVSPQTEPSLLDQDMVYLHGLLFQSPLQGAKENIRSLQPPSPLFR